MKKIFEKIKSRLNIRSVRRRTVCNHEWIITGAGFTVCKKCKVIH